MTLKQIQATQEIMCLAINGQNHVDSLIGYYRDSIDRFNDERMQWAIYYQNCKENVSNKHLLERQLNDINSKRVDLQGQLATLKGKLTHQRQKYFNRIQQSQRIKQNLQENKKRFRQITEICRPLNMDNSRVKSAYSIKTKAYESAQKLGQKFQKENIDHGLQKSDLELQLINMSRQHEEKKDKLQSIINELKEQLQQLVSEHSNRRQLCSKEYQEALNKLSDLESKNMNLVMQFFRYRMDNLQEQQKVQEQNEIIRLKNMALVQKLKTLQDAHSTEFKNIDSEVKKKNKEFKQKYDQQLKNKQQHLSILKEQHERISEIYLNKLKKLQGDLRTTTQKTKIIEQKTRVEVQSLKSQIKILSNRIQNVGLSQMKKDLIENEEQSQESSAIDEEQLQKLANKAMSLDKKLHNNIKKN